MKTLTLVLLLSTTAFGQSFAKPEKHFFDPNGGSEKVDYAAIWAGVILDITSTQAALNRPGTHEANPLFRNSTTRVVGELGIAGFQSFVVHKLQPNHSHAAFWMSMITSGVRAGIAVHNYRVH